MRCLVCVGVSVAGSGERGESMCVGVRAVCMFWVHDRSCEGGTSGGNKGTKLEAGGRERGHSAGP